MMELNSNAPTPYRTNASASPQETPYATTVRSVYAAPFDVVTINSADTGRNVHNHATATEWSREAAASTSGLEQPYGAASAEVKLL